MPSGNQAETVRGPRASFFYDSAQQLASEYGDAMPGGTASLAKHVLFPDSFTDEIKAGVLSAFGETGKLDTLSSISSNVDLFLDVTKAPDLYLWRFWLVGCVLDPRREDSGMVELSACSPHGYGVFSRPDSARAYYESYQLSRGVGSGVDVTDAAWVLGNLTKHILNDPFVKNRLEQMLLYRAEREQHLIEEGVPLDGDPYNLPPDLDLGYAASMRLEQLQRGFMSVIGYDGGPEEPINLPKLADLSDADLTLSSLREFGLVAIGT